MSKNPMYQSDILWYDPSVKAAVAALDEQYDNAISVFGGALTAANHLAHGDMDAFCKCLHNVIRNVYFYHWHEDPLTAVRRFCNICHADPVFVESYLGATFDKII